MHCFLLYHVEHAAMCWLVLVPAVWSICQAVSEIALICLAVEMLAAAIDPFGNVPLSHQQQ